MAINGNAMDEKSGKLIGQLLALVIRRDKYMNTITVLTGQITLFVIYILTGVLLIRTRVLNRENLEVISKLVIKLALPVMIFINTINGVERKTLFHSLSILVIAVYMYLFLFGISYIAGKFLHLQGDHAQLYSAMSAFGNVGFMGIPIVTSIYPENGMLYMSVFTIIDQLMLWTVGVRLTSKKTAESGSRGAETKCFQVKKLVNPVTVAIFLALLCVLTGISLPEILNTACMKIGGTATPLSMIYLGGIFASINATKYLKQVDYYGIVITKMLIFPVLFYLFLGIFPISMEIRVAMTLVSAMPVMASVVMMANTYGTDGDYAMGGILITTLCSIVILPFVYWILQFI